MGTRLNGYYNNPQIGEAFSNLAGLFAPPEARDVVAYAQAAKLRQETQGLTDLYQEARDPGFNQSAFDRLGIATGQWAPTQGYHALDVNDATERYNIGVDSADSRYGTDRSYAASTENNAATNATTLATNANTVQGNLVGDLFGPLSQGQVRPAVPDDIMAQFEMPGVAGVAGAPMPKTQAQVEGDLLLEAISKDYVGAPEAAIKYRSDIPTDEIVDAATGKPKLVYTSEAVGQEPYTPKGSQAGFVTKTYITPDGKKGTARADPNQAIAPVDAMTNEPLPQGTILGDITDTQSGMTASTNSKVQAEGIAINDTKATVQRLKAMIAENPGATGLAGRIRGTAQDVIATGDDLARQWGGQIAEMQAEAAANPELAAIMGPGGFDPSIPAIDMQATLLSFQIAKVLAGGDRISNQQFDFARSMVGSSATFANTQTTAAKLAEIEMFLDGMAGRRENVQATPIQRVTEQLDASDPAAPAPVAPPAAPEVTATGPNGEKLVLRNGAWTPK